MADSVLRDKAKQFAKNIVFLCREIKSIHKETTKNVSGFSNKVLGYPKYFGRCHTSSLLVKVTDIKRYLSHFEF